ncbi:hypothetical protein CBEIJ_38250 [Clostridium beijerinckii]|nr:hypothetical protein CBEIJ_38250 [Clostridium beijerinckii]
MVIKWKEENIVEIMILIARIIMLILEGVTAKTATENIAREYGMNASKLWNALPKIYK